MFNFFTLYFNQQVCEKKSIDLRIFMFFEAQMFSGTPTIYGVCRHFETTIQILAWLTPTGLLTNFDGNLTRKG